MKQNINRALALILAGSVALSGCATMESGTNSVTQKVGGIFGSSNDNTKAVTGGAILGCAGGAILGRIIGGGSAMLKGCAGGAVVGGVVSYKVHRDELKKARALAAEAEATKGVTAVVTTKTVDAKDDNGQATKTEALDKLTIALPAKDVQTHAPAVQRILVKAANVSDSSAEQTTIEAKGTAAERTWMTDQIQQALKSGSTVKVIQTEAQTPSLVISPIPSAK